MNKIVVVLTRRVKKGYKALPPAVQKKFKKQVRFLKANPKHPSLQILRILGSSYWELYRLSEKLCGIGSACLV